MLFQFLRRIKFWLLNHREQSAIDEEMRLHMQLRAERISSSGVDIEEAGRAARRHFGNQLQFREASREMWISRWFDDFLRDVQIGSRALMRNPGFTAVAVLTLALGLGANTAIFSVIHTVLLKPLPYRDAGRILQISRVFKGGDRATEASASKFVYLRDHAAAFQSVAAMDFAPAGFSLTNFGEPERISGSRISSEMFAVLGSSPVVGSVFTAAQDKSGTEDVVVISHKLWQRRFQGAPSVIGSRITLNGRPHTVLGVMPRGFLATGSTSEDEIWVPMRATFDPTDNANTCVILARLKDSISLQNANAELLQIARGMRTEFPALVGDNSHFAAILYREFLVGDVKPALFVLAGAVGLVLLLACANVANLLLARAISRQKEIAIRTSIGASAFRLLRQLLTESLLLSLSASAVGLLLASFGMRALLRSLPESIPWSGEIAFDPLVLVFTFSIAVFTGLIFGIAPAWSSSHLPIAETLKAATGRLTSSAAANKLRRGLVGVEVAVSVVLIVGAALLVQSFLRLRNVSMGFDPSNVLTMKLALQKHKDTRSMMTFVDPLLQRINNVQGINAAGTATSLPLELGPDWEYQVEGRTDVTIDAQFRAVSPRYLEAMNIRLIGGRQFTDRDNSAAPPVIIINQSFARRAFKSGSAIGQRLRVPADSPPWLKEPPREIIGIVADVHEEGLRKQPPPAVYVPHAQLTDAVGQMINRFLPLSLVVRTQGSPLQSAQSVKQIVMSVDPLQPVGEIRSMDEIVNRATSRDRFNLTLMGLFAVVALTLASIGIYGVVSYAVSQRTQEIGVRIALGASFQDVMRLVIGEGMFISMVGVAVGLAGALALSQFLARLLFSIKPADPATFLFVAALMLTVAFLANLVPALRASRLDPIKALRYE